MKILKTVEMQDWVAATWNESQRRARVESEALRLADCLMEPVVLDKHAMQAAAELRRLHAENEAFRNALKNAISCWQEEMAYRPTALSVADPWIAAIDAARSKE